MQWQQWCAELVEVLGLFKTPVGVTYADDLPEGVTTPKCRACSAIHQASQGIMLALSAENSACPGGSLYLGFRAQAPEQAAHLRDFLINGEKLLSCPAAAYRLQKSGVQPPLGMANYALFAPLDKMPLRPDVTVVFCNPAQAARLVSLAWYETGEALQCDPSGASCRSVITYPLVTNRFNVSFGDITERRSEKLPADEMYVSLPWTVLRSVVASLDGSSAGRATMDLSKMPH